LAAYFVIFIMLASTAGIAIGFLAGGGSSSSDDNSNVSVNPEDLISLNYEATVNATVNEITKTYMLFSDTNNFDITVIDRDIRRIDGVSNVDSYFRLNDDASISSANYKYIATISGYGINQETFYEDLINATTYLENVSLMPYALIEFDHNVTFTNSDLNITKEYEYGQPQATVIIGPSTEVGDNIEVQLYVTFLGGSITQTIGEETRNLTTEPQNFVSMQTLPFELERSYVGVQGDINSVDLSSFDVNIDYQYDSNSMSVLTLDSDLDLLLLELEGYDVNSEGYWLGKVFVSEVSNLVQVYDYNEYVDVQLPYGDYTLDENISFILTTYLQRDEILGITAEPSSQGSITIE